MSRHRGGGAGGWVFFWTAVLCVAFAALAVWRVYHR
jgi:hypothetical protein